LDELEEEIAALVHHPDGALEGELFEVHLVQDILTKDDLHEIRFGFDHVVLLLRVSPIRWRSECLAAAQVDERELTFGAMEQDVLV